VATKNRPNTASRVCRLQTEASKRQLQAAEHSHEAEHRQAGQIKHAYLNHTGDPFAQDDVPSRQVRRQQILQSAANFFICDRPGHKDRRAQDEQDELLAYKHRREHAADQHRDVGLLRREQALKIENEGQACQLQDHPAGIKPAKDVLTSPATRQQHLLI
jgi:hypothetical protein